MLQVSDLFVSCRSLPEFLPCAEILSHRKIMTWYLYGEVPPTISVVNYDQQSRSWLGSSLLRDNVKHLSSDPPSGTPSATLLITFFSQKRTCCNETLYSALFLTLEQCFRFDSSTVGTGCHFFSRKVASMARRGGVADFLSLPFVRE
jgi:hypothetical protein